MNNVELLKHISFNLTSVAHSTVGKEWNYRNVISSYSRLYLITDGEAVMWVNGQEVRLKKDHLYLVPSFTQCTLLCESMMAHYYATFTVSLPGDMSVYQLFNVQYDLKFENFFSTCFAHLLEINPDISLPVVDPLLYQKTYLNMRPSVYVNPKISMQTSGLLNMLFSGFIVSTKIDLSTESYSRIVASIKYIHKHLNTILSVATLAKSACMTSDHFTRQFKLLTSQTPIEYINRQRIEKAQLLLNATSYTCSEIADRCGFKSNAYFSRIFKKYVDQSPVEYRNNHLL